MRFVSCAAVVALLWGGPACPAALVKSHDSAVFSLGAPTLSGPSGQLVNFDVYMTYSVIPTQSTYKVWLLELDVSASSSQLDPGGNFSAWSFSPDNSVLNPTGWGPGFLNSPSTGVFEYEDATASTRGAPTTYGLLASASPYHIGTLTYNLAQFGVTLNPHEITPAAALVGAITGANTTVADQKPGSVTTAGYMDVSFSNLTFNPGSEPFPSPAATTAPAPAGALLASLGGALLLAGRLVRRRFAA